jgi:hypothetical protein
MQFARHILKFEYTLKLLCMIVGLFALLIPKFPSNFPIYMWIVVHEAGALYW